jgi:hypothetical protein
MSKEIRTSDAPELGPAMRALPVHWQRAVTALFITKGNRTQAVKLAGTYNTDNHGSIKQLAYRLFGDARVRLAIREVAGALIETAEPELLAITLDIMRDSTVDAKDRLMAARMVWNRANPVITKHKIDVEHHLTSNELDVQHYRALQKLGAPMSAFLARFGHNGLERVEALIAADNAKVKQIEGTVAGDVIEAEIVE